jgi:hypothetical protein
MMKTENESMTKGKKLVTRQFQSSGLGHLFTYSGVLWPPSVQLLASWQRSRKGMSGSVANMIVSCVARSVQESRKLDNGSTISDITSSIKS